jgi:prepilin-type N-terminal cleavage/methylation domain-containing protein
MSTASRRPGPGVTLVEILIGLLVLGVFATMAAQAVVIGYRNYNYSIRYMDDYRRAEVGLYRMSRELRQCELVYAPDPNTLFADGNTVNPTKAQPFVFEYQSYSADAPLLVSYQLDNQNANNGAYQLLRYQYDPGATTAPLASQLIAPEVLTFSVTHVSRSGNYGLLCILAKATVPGRAGPQTIEIESPVWEIAPNE